MFSVVRKDQSVVHCKLVESLSPSIPPSISKRVVIEPMYNYLLMVICLLYIWCSSFYPLYFLSSIEPTPRERIDEVVKFLCFECFFFISILFIYCNIKLVLRFFVCLSTCCFKWSVLIFIIIFVLL